MGLLALTKWRRNAVVAVLAVGALHLIGFGLLARQDPAARVSDDDSGMSQQDQAAVEAAAAQLGDQLGGVAAFVEDLADQASRGRPFDELFADVARPALQDDPTILAVGHTPVAPPHVMIGLLRADDKVHDVAMPATDLDVYTPLTAWFHEARVDGPGWHRPQPLPNSGELVVVYAAPVCAEGPCDLRKDEPTSVVSAMVALRDLEATTRQLDLGAGAESLVVTRDGDLVVHPRMDLVRRGMSAHELAWRAGDADLAEALVEIEEGRMDSVGPRLDPQTGRREHLSWVPFGGQEPTHALIAHVPIITTASQTELRHGMVLRLVAWLPLALLAFVLLALVVVQRGKTVAWLASGAASTAAVLMIVGLWTAAAKHPTPPAPDDLPILSTADLARFERNWTQASGAPRFEAIGMFLQSIEFQSANNVTIAGMAWQRLPTDDCAAALDAEPEPNFFFPEADPGEELQVALAYHQCDPLRHEELQGWRFRALLRQDFDYLLYPFDPQELWVRILPVEFDKNVVLVPDLLSYDRTARELTPGLDRELILPGWDIVGSGFAYRRRAYNTDFGVSNYVGQSDFPELVYTVTLRRSFLGPFVGKIIPLGVAAAMLFCMLLLGTREPEYEGSFGFSAMEVVLGAAALFFVVIFDHSALRDDLATTKPFYLEYFYFVMYLALVAVCANAIAFAMQRGRLVRFADNILPKMLFWPLYLGAIALLTTAIFW